MKKGIRVYSLLSLLIKTTSFLLTCKTTKLKKYNNYNLYIHILEKPFTYEAWSHKIMFQHTILFTSFKILFQLQQDTVLNFTYFPNQTMEQPNNICKATIYLIAKMKNDSIMIIKQIVQLLFYRNLYITIWAQNWPLVIN